MTRSRYNGGSGDSNVEDGSNLYEMLQWQTSSGLYEPTLTPVGLEGLMIGATAFPADEKDGIYSIATVTTEKIGRGGNFELRQTGIANGTSAGTGFFGAAYTAGANDFDHIHGSQAWVFAEGSGTVGRIAGSMATATVNTGQTVDALYGFYFPGFTGTGIAAVTNKWGLYIGGVNEKSFMSGEVILGDNTDPAIDNDDARGSRLTATDICTITTDGFGTYLSSKPIIAVMSNSTAAERIGGVLGLGGRTGFGTDPYIYAHVQGAKNTAGSSYSGACSIWTSSGGEGTETASVNYERLRITPTQATFYQGLEVQGNVGFYATTPVTQNQLATGVGATVDNVITELQRLGLVRQAA